MTAHDKSAGDEWRKDFTLFLERLDELRQLIERTELEGCLVEMDALHTQDETVQKLLHEKGADYMVSIKDNQPTLATTAQTLLPQDVPPSGSQD